LLSRKCIKIFNNKQQCYFYYQKLFSTFVIRPFLELTLIYIIFSVFDQDMSLHKSDKIKQDLVVDKTAIPPTQGKSFLEVLLHESTGDDFLEIEQDAFAELAIPDKNKRKKKFKFIRFPNLKEILDNMNEAEPEKPDCYIIMDNDKSLKANEMEAARQEAYDRDDTEEFLNSISDRLKEFAHKGFKNTPKDSLSWMDNKDSLQSEIIKSITEDNNIISETLANLLVAQGQNSKAVKMYQALCLKFPEKSIYFAKKIKQLQA
jgi:hypothetical protein